MNGNLKIERPSYIITLKHFTVRDGTRIACRVLEPRGDACAVLVFLHGATLNSQLYLPIGVRLASNFRMQTVLVDMRGHGESEGRRGHVDYIGQLEDDIHDILSVLKRESPGLPLFLGAHCVFSSVLVHYADMKGITPPDGYVFLGPPVPVFPINSGRKKTGHNGADDVVSKFHVMRLIILEILNRVGFTAFNTLPIVHFSFPQEVASRVQTKVKTYSYSMFRQMDAQKYFYGFKNINRPLLMIIGQADTMVQPEDLKLVFDQYVPSGIDKSFIILAKYDHFNIIWGAGKAIGEWITEKIGNHVDKALDSAGNNNAL